LFFFDVFLILNHKQAITRSDGFNRLSGIQISLSIALKSNQKAMADLAQLVANFYRLSQFFDQI